MTPCPHLHQVDVLSAELVLGQVLSVHDPWVFQDLNCRQALMRVHMEHLGHNVLRGRQQKQLREPPERNPFIPSQASLTIGLTDSLHLGVSVYFRL